MSEEPAWIVDVTAQTFEREVVQRSFEQPVLLDLWAPWCEPCKQLGPLLEQRARDGAGRFVLAKVNVDANPELAQALRVQGIPAVIALSHGQLVDGFEGALPEAELDRFLDRVAPGGPATADPTEELVARARALAEEDKGPEAITLLRDHLRGTPEAHAVRLALADLLVDAGKASEAQLLFDKLPEELREGVEGKALASRLALADEVSKLDELRAAAAAAPEDFDARLVLGKALLANKEHEAGLEELLEAVRLAQLACPQRVEEAKDAMLATFEQLGLEDPVANDYRFKLSLELFA